MRTDADFDVCGQEFLGSIYGSSKGTVRIEVLLEEVLTGVPRLAAGGLTVLDVGGGAGQFSIRLAELGNEVVLADPSRQMLAAAAVAVERAGVADRVTLVHADIQTLRHSVDRRFGAVLCHAVLEWLANPRAAVVDMAQFLDVTGVLSIAFYNRNASILNQILRGDFADGVLEASGRVRPRGCGRGALPLAEADVREWVRDAGLAVRSKAGIRIFHDYVRPIDRGEDRLRELLKVERSLRRQEPFASLGQHIHLLCMGAGGCNGAT